MMSSCCTLRLNRRRALSIDSPSWIFTSATRLTPPSRVAIHANMLGYHSDRRILGAIPVNVNDLDAVNALADREQIDFTVVGPEMPLSRGVADRFQQEGRLLFGPTAAAARLESSKAFAKAFMARHFVPTARFRACESLDDA